MDYDVRIAKMEATVETLQAEIALLRQAIETVRQENSEKLDRLRDHIDHGLAEQREHSDKGLASLREHTDKGLAELREHSDKGIAELHRALRWHSGLVLTCFIALAGLMARNGSLF